MPGTPKNDRNIEKIIADAVNDAVILEEEGVDAIMIENMHDRPYLNRIVGPEVIAAMTTVACNVRKKVSLPLGIQVLAGANKEELAIALAAGSYNFV